MFGDSKLVNSASDGSKWWEILADQLISEQGINPPTSRHGYGGATVVSYADDLIDGALAGSTAKGCEFALINLGVNDFSSLGDAATWNDKYLYIIDQIQSKWPGVEIYLMRPWAQGRDTEADEVASRINTIIAARSGVYLGPDERVWLKGGDNGATMTSDGTHYSGAGSTEASQQWMDLLFP